MENISLYSPPAAEVEISGISADPLDLNLLLKAAQDPKAGAVVIFSGEVRNHNVGRAVLHLDYEVYEELATKMIREVTATAIEKFNLHKAVCVHRSGKVGISESAVVVITASSHRKEAYKANEYIIEVVKHEAPIWKREYFTDGTSSWSRNCGCH